MQDESQTQTYATPRDLLWAYLFAARDLAETEARLEAQRRELALLGPQVVALVDREGDLEMSDRAFRVFTGPGGERVLDVRPIRSAYGLNWPADPTPALEPPAENGREYRPLTLIDGTELQPYVPEAS